jgi:hypothetical protein
MNFVAPTKYINIDEYEYVVSIGNKCPTTMILRELNIYREAFPFDYIPTTAGLILKYLQNQSEFYPLRGVIRTRDNVWFGHYNINDKYDDTIETFKKRFIRLFDILKNKKKILFVYTSEADVYNEMNNRYNDNYDNLLKIVTYLTETYKYNNFKLLCINTNKTFDDTDNIVNYRINVPIIYCSDDMSTHIDSVYSQYRSVLKNLLKQILKCEYQGA